MFQTFAISILDATKIYQGSNLNLVYKYFIDYLFLNYFFESLHVSIMQLFELVITSLKSLTP